MSTTTAVPTEEITFPTILGIDPSKVTAATVKGALAKASDSRVPLAVSAVIYCHKSGESTRDMAARFGVDQSTVSEWLNAGRVMLAIGHGMTLAQGRAVLYLFGAYRTSSKVLASVAPATTGPALGKAIVKEADRVKGMTAEERKALRTAKRAAGGEGGEGEQGEQGADEPKGKATFEARCQAAQKILATLDGKPNLSSNERIALDALAAQVRRIALESGLVKVAADAQSVESGVARVSRPNVTSKRRVTVADSAPSVGIAS